MSDGLQSFVPDLSPENLEAERIRFSNFVVSIAARHTDRKTFLADLRQLLPAGFITKFGEGTTRRVYSTPLGICLKVQRGSPWSDTIPDSQLQARGGEAHLLELAPLRRIANLSELVFATAHPRLMPKQYGFLGSFGIMQQHPSVLIAETCIPLNQDNPDDRIGIDHANLAVDATGHLRIFDPRVTSEPKPDDLQFFTDGGRTSRPNLGTNPEGKYVFLDRSDKGDVVPLINLTTFIPKSWNGGWMWAAPLDKTIEFSKSLLTEYQKAWKAANPTERTI